MKHIRLYLFVLFTACSMFMVCPFAYADSISDNISSVYDVISLFQSDMTTSDYNTLISYIEDYSSCCLLYNANEHSFLLNCTNTPGSFGATQSSNFTPVRISGSFFISNNSSTGTVLTAYCDSVGGLYLYTRSGTGSLYQYIDTDYKAYYFTTNYIITNDNHNYSIPFANCYHFYTSDFEDVVYQSGSSYYLVNNTSYVDNKVISMESQSYTDDDRLKLYKLWSSQNGDSLVVDLSAFRSYTPAAAYEFSNISLTLTCNGVDSVYNLPLSSSTINNGWDNNSNLYTISTPVNDFTLSDTYDTYITKVSFSLDESSPGGSGSTPFYISANYPLDGHHSSITPGAVLTPATIYDDPAKPIDISDRQYDFFQQLQSSVMGGDIVYINNYPVLPSWANVYNLNTFFYDNNPDDLHIYLGTQITGAFRAEKYDFDIKAFLYDNATSNFYDVVIIRIDDTDWPMIINNNTIPDSQSLYGYVVLYTDSYYKRLDAETQFNILQALQLDANQQLANWSWLVAKLDDFENKSLEILNPLYDETTYIDDKLASILYAVNSIENYNDSSIVSLLTDIKNLLSSPENEIDTPQECIQLYEAHPNYFNELWGTPTPALRSASVTPSANNPYISSDYVRADLVPAWWEGKTLTMIYILKNDGETSRFYNDILNGLFDSYENLIESDNSFNTYIDSLFKTGYDYTSSFYGHLFDLDYNPEAWNGGFVSNE